MPVPYFINYTIVKLASALTTTDTTLTLNEQGRFPTTLPTDYYFHAVIHDGIPSSQTKEIIKVTAINNLTWTIERGQIGTTARNWPANTSYIEPIYTYQMFKDALWVKFIVNTNMMNPIFPVSKNFYNDVIKYFYSDNKNLILLNTITEYYYLNTLSICYNINQSAIYCGLKNIKSVNIGRSSLSYEDNYNYNINSNPIYVTLEDFVIKKGTTTDNKDVHVIGRGKFYGDYGYIVFHPFFEIRKVKNNNTNIYEHNILYLWELIGYYESIETPPTGWHTDIKMWRLADIAQYNKYYRKYYSDTKNFTYENCCGIPGMMYTSTINFVNNNYTFKDLVVMPGFPIAPNTNIINPKFYFSSSFPFVYCSSLIDLHTQQANSTFSIGFNSTTLTVIFNAYGRIFVKRIFFVCHSYTECTTKPVVSITAANTAGNLVTNYTINVTGPGIYPIPFTNRTFSISGGSTNVNRYIYTITLVTPPSPGICRGFFIIEYAPVIQLRFAHS